MTAEWKEYTGTDEQIAEMCNAGHGFIWRDNNSGECVSITELNVFMGRHHLARYLKERSCIHYLTCNPHPLADMIIRQAQTGQPVWVKVKGYEAFPSSKAGETYWWDGVYSILKTNQPDWNITGAEYSFTPFEGEK